MPWPRYVQKQGKVETIEVTVCSRNISIARPLQKLLVMNYNSSVLLQLHYKRLYHLPQVPIGFKELGPYLQHFISSVTDEWANKLERNVTL